MHINSLVGRLPYCACTCRGHLLLILIRLFIPVGFSDRSLFETTLLYNDDLLESLQQVVAQQFNFATSTAAGKYIAMNQARPRLLSLVAALVFLCSETGISEISPDPLATQQALIASGRFREAEASLNTYLKDRPASSDAHFLLGYVFFREQKAKESLGESTEGAKGRRPTAGELEIVASDYVLLGDFPDADKWFTEVTVEAPNNANAWYLLGRTKYNEERFNEAVSCFQRTISLRPRYVEAENNLGLSWSGLNKLDLAKAAFQTAIDWQGNSAKDAQPYLNLGTLLADQNELDKAIPILTRAVALSPENPKAHEQLASAYERQSDLPKAQSEMERAVNLSPETSSLHFKLGQIYRKQRMLELAQREFGICAKLNSTHSSTATPNPFPSIPSAPK